MTATKYLPTALGAYKANPCKSNANQLRFAVQGAVGFEGRKALGTGTVTMIQVVTLAELLIMGTPIDWIAAFAA